LAGKQGKGYLDIAEKAHTGVDMQPRWSSAGVSVPMSNDCTFTKPSYIWLMSGKTLLEIIKLCILILWCTSNGTDPSRTGTTEHYAEPGITFCRMIFIMTVFREIFCPGCNIN